MSNMRRIVASLILVALIVLTFFSVIDLPFKHIDDRTAEYLADVRNQALGAWVIASTLNAVISWLQGTEMTFSLGFGLVTKPGELLDPVNDLVEALAILMLKAIGITATQEILALITAWISFRFFLIVSLSLLLLAVWLPNHKMNFRYLASRFFLITVMLRFAFPVSAYVGIAISEKFLDQRYEKAIAEMEEIQKKVEEIKPPEIKNGQPDPQSQHWWENGWQKFKDAFGSGKDLFDIKNKFMAAFSLAKNMMVYVATLIAVFAIKTIILPLGVFLFIYRSTGYLLKKVLP